MPPPPPPPPPPPLPPPPPPVTPSPHRFLAPTAAAKAFLPIKPQQQSQQPTPQTLSHQFTAAPKFSFASQRKLDDGLHTSSSQASSPIVSRRLHKLLLNTQAREDIEEAASDPSGDEQSRILNPGNDSSIDSDDNSIQQTSSSPPPHPKRRRLKTPQPPSTNTISRSPPPPSSPPVPTNPNPQTLIITPPRPTPHFHTPQPITQSQPPRFLSTLQQQQQQQQPSTPSLPKFLLPASPSPPPPLPSTLSPPRPGQQYVPGGLASTLRDLVLETSLQASHHGRGGHSRSEGWDFRIGVEEVRSGEWVQGMVLVRERGGRGWALMGKGIGGEDVERGCTIGIRRPVWEVEVLGERWAVGVEWRVLGQ